MKASRLLLLCLALMVVASAAIAAKAPAKGSGADPGVDAEWWGRPPGQRPVCIGEVANVSPTNIAVKTPQGVKPFVVDQNTKVFVHGEQATINDVKVGDPVGVKFKLVTNNVPLALVVRVPKPRVAGKIIAVAGDVVTVKNKDGEAKFVVTEATKYRSHGYEGTLADLRVGYWAGAVGASDGANFVADIVQFKPAVAKGAVIAKEGDVITVKTVRQLTIPCLASPATAVLIRPRIGPNKKGTLADVQVGMPCDIGFHPNPQGNAPLLWIDLLVG